MSINIVIVVTYLIFLMIWTFSFNLCCRFYLIHATSKIAYAYYFGNCCLFNPVCFFRLPVIICVCLLIFCGGVGGGGGGVKDIPWGACTGVPCHDYINLYTSDSFIY